MTLSHKHRQRGVTLFELLIVLALIALTAAGMGHAITKMSPRLAVNSAANQLVADLKRARLEMTQTGAPVMISFSEGGYVIEALAVTRQWPRDVEARISSTRENEILFAHAARLQPYAVILSKGGADVRITVAPVTHRIAIAPSHP